MLSFCFIRLYCLGWVLGSCKTFVSSWAKTRSVVSVENAWNCSFHSSSFRKSTTSQTINVRNYHFLGELQR